MSQASERLLSTNHKERDSGLRGMQICSIRMHRSRRSLCVAGLEMYHFMPASEQLPLLLCQEGRVVPG